MFRRWAMKLATIYLLIALFLAWGTSLLAEEALTKGTERHIGYGSGDTFTNCDGIKIEVEGGHISNTSEKCPPRIDALTVEKQTPDAAKSAEATGVAATTGISTKAMVSGGGVVALIVLLIIIL